MRFALTAIMVCAVVMPVSAETFRLGDAALLDSSFDRFWNADNTSTLDGKSPLGGGGVTYDITLEGNSGGKMSIGDPWPASSSVGLLWDAGLSHYTSLEPFDGYSMLVQYLEGPANSTIDIALFMNTGLTGPSGFPSLDVTNDTYWSSPWVELSLGESALIELDFSSSVAYNISDNPEPHTGGGLGLTDGELYGINERDLNEISNIGFEIADFSGDTFGGQVTLGLNIVLEPATAAICLLGAVAWGIRRRRS